MRRSAYLGLALFSFFGLGADNVNFDHEKAGHLPPTWSVVQTHSGPRGDWMIRRDPAAPSKPNVVSQMSRSGAKYEFDLAIFEKTVCRDGDLSVKFRLRQEPGTRTAGLVFRFRDENDYYLAHFSADEGNVMIFHVLNGKATALPRTGAKAGQLGVDHEIRSGVWYLGKVVFRGRRIRVMLGNRQLFEAQDDAPVTAGKTGIWTKGSTVASFDDFRLDKKD